ncbi:MAG: glycosyltransferase family 39 protein [Bacteroidales bacterium]|nr:glycosyltransferase family 39 protein [Bacteroidales bacterium]
MKQIVLSQFQKPWIYLIITILGVSLKFYNLNYKIFWEDEIYTVQHVIGAHNILEIDPGTENKILDLSYYRGLLKNSSQEHTLGEELSSQLSTMNLNPLHYIFLSFWYRLIGDDILHYRLFSVLIFILTLPFLYFLARKLFQSDIVAWIATSLYSVSPFIHVFAQEARYYILWAFILVVLHFFLVYALDKKKLIWWAGYALAGILALYCSVLSGLILFEHLLFILIVYRKDFRKFAGSGLVMLLAYLPWLLLILNHSEEVVSSLAWHKMPEKMPFWAPALGITLGYVRTFSFYKEYTLYWDDVFGNITPDLLVETFFNLCILAFLVLALVKMRTYLKKESSLFLLLIFIPGFLLFYFLDLFRNAVTSIWWRYHIFATIPVILIASGYFVGRMQKRKLAAVLIYVGLVVISLFSVRTISQQKYWYLAGDWVLEFVNNAELLSDSEKALVITDFTRADNTWAGPTLTMQVLVNCTSDQIDVLRVGQDVPDMSKLIPEDTYSDIYLLYPSSMLVEAMSNQFGERMQILEGRRGPTTWIIHQAED